MFNCIKLILVESKMWGKKSKLDFTTNLDQFLESLLQYVRNRICLNCRCYDLIEGYRILLLPCSNSLNCCFSKL